jgi:hypothetical protein
VALDSRRHVAEWRALLADFDKLLSGLAGAAAEGVVLAEGRQSSLREHARALHQELQALRDKAEAQVSQTEGILLLAESPMEDILAGAAAARTRGGCEEQGRGGGGGEVWRRKVQMLEVKTQVEK